MPPRLLRARLSLRGLGPEQRAGFSTTCCRPQKKSDPLRILFCGSDEFSIAALRALHKEHSQNDSLIKSLDVVLRPGKPTGRGMKTIREVPIKSAAQELGLPMHELNTFTGWAPSFDVNLIIAVSFGLLVPPRLLRLAKYGGLNLHPSLLPDFRGPAPLHHTLLQNRQYTGVTLQTLHESKFDHGTILAQTPQPGLLVPENATLQALHDLITPVAAEMLVQGLRDGVHVPPHQPVHQNEVVDGSGISHAPKLVKSDRQIQWSEWSAADFARYLRVLGPLWTEARTRDGKKKRVIFEEVEAVEASSDGEEATGTITWFDRSEQSTGSSPAARGVSSTFTAAQDGSDAVFIPAAKGGLLKVAKVKVEGDKSKAAARALAAFADPRG